MKLLPKLANYQSETELARSENLIDKISLLLISILEEGGGEFVEVCLPLPVL